MFIGRLNDIVPSRSLFYMLEGLGLKISGPIGLVFEDHYEYATK